VLRRPVGVLDAGFGDGFGSRLLTLPMGEWSLIQSREGWHVVRLDTRKPGQLANFDDWREEVSKRWVSNETRKQTSDAVNRLKASYKIKYE
jgi:parvulin-like peptidyl-prolyl isomerase